MIVDGLKHLARGVAWTSVPRPDFGLCDSCRHQRLVRNTRGSTFSLCGRSKDDPSYPRYPRVPVLECPGFEPEEDGDEAETRRASTS
jgi:hypothetical protein